MKLNFIGTRGYIDISNPRHVMHTALEVSHAGKAVMIDCGLDWIEEVHRRRPKAIVLTHAHPDHAFGLERGSPCPVYATAETWKSIEAYPINQRHVVEPRVPIEIRGITFEAFKVEHSITSPAVGYRITAGRVSVFYSPDLIYIEDRAAAFKGIRIYIGDGATIQQSFVRKQGEHLIGHTPVRTQVGWCAKEGVSRMIVTHCGRDILTSEEDKLLAILREFAASKNVEQLDIAYDGMQLSLR